MAFQLSTAGLARVSARRPWLVVTAWVVATVLAAGGAAFGLGDVITTEATFVNRPESLKGLELLDRGFQNPAEEQEETNWRETIVIRSETLTVDDSTFQQRVEQLTADLRALSGVIDPQQTVNVYMTQAAGSELAGDMISADRHATLIPTALRGSFDQATEQLPQYLEIINRYNADGFTVASAGEVTVDDQFLATSSADLEKEIYGLPVALVVLVVIFGALVAAGVPLVLGMTAIIVSLGLTALIGQVWELSLYVVNMITVIGLAVGVDYALFVVERYREERRRGIPQSEAIVLAGGTASKAVLFSGLTVVLALTGMFLIPTTIFRSLGLGAILVTIVAVVATLTLTPALLSLLGDKIDWPRRRYDAPPPHGTVVEDASGSNPYRGFWGRVTRSVMARPAISAVLAAGILILAALPSFELETGTAGPETLPPGNVRTAVEILDRDFYAGVLAPIEIAIGGTRTPEMDAALDRLVAALGQDPAFGPVLEREWNRANDVARLVVPLQGDANSDEAYEAVERLRKVTIPPAFAGVRAEVYVAGDPAFNADFKQVVADWTPVVFAFVLGLSFLLLLLAFRSVVVPVKAILMNLLSVGAAYGLTVLVFQKGYGDGLLGFQRVPTIEAWVPIFLFCVLFGLSMDYHVFLLSRIRERFDETGDNRDSVAFGLQATARIITGAAVIMVVVFGAFALGDLVMFQQMGFGLAVAILIDATLIRSVLVPASMVLLGERNWYLPRWLRWLPDLQVEGAQRSLLSPTPAPSRQSEVAPAGD